MSTTKKIVFLSLAVAIILAIAAVLWQQGIVGNPNRRLLNRIKDQPAMVILFNKALAKEVEIAKTPEEAGLYFDDGLAWKSIAEQMRGTEPERKIFFVKSLEVYEMGIAKFGQKNILFYLNGGKLAERIEDYIKAETYYKKAIEISPADESGYLSLVDLYSYRMNKSEEEILKVFSAGETIMVNRAPLVSGRATYLRRIGDYANALKDYQILSQAFPNIPGYKEIIQELKSKLQIK